MTTRNASAARSILGGLRHLTSLARARARGAFLLVMAFALSTTTTSGQTFSNRSFETGDYTGWLLTNPFGGSSNAWGIATDGQTIQPGEPIFDYLQGQLEPANLTSPVTFDATEGQYAAYHIGSLDDASFFGGLSIVSTEATICPSATNLHWDAAYRNGAGFQQPFFQDLIVRAYEPISQVQYTLADSSGALEVPQMTSFSADVSFLRGYTIGLSFWVGATYGPFQVAVDNIYVEGCDDISQTDLPPICEIGGIDDLECAAGPLATTLDAGASSDPEGGPLDYSWQVTCGTAFTLDDPSRVNPTLTLEKPLCAQTSCSVGLTVMDAGGQSTTCTPQVVSVFGSQSVADLVFDNAVTSVQMAPGTSQTVMVDVQNTGSCPSEIVGYDVLEPLSPSPHVQIVGILQTTSCPQGYRLQLAIDTTGFGAGTFERRVRLQGSDGSSVSATIEITVGSLLPDLTPISATSSSLLVAGDQGGPPLAENEGATITVQIRNVGAAVAGSYDVNFFADGDLLGTVPGTAGLLPGGSASVQLSVPAGTFSVGTHVLSVSVATPPDAESNTANNSATGYMQVGAFDPGEGVVMEVVASASGACENGLLQVSGSANYRFFPSDATFPVKGGPATLEIRPLGSSTVIASAPLGHTDTNGRFGIVLDAPAVGAYTAVVEVTDLTLTGSTESDFTIEASETCTPPPPPPPPPPAPTLGFASCEKDAAGLPIEFGDPIFTVDSQLCAASGFVKAHGVTVRGAGNYSPALLGLRGEFFSPDGEGDFSSQIYETAALDPIALPFEESLSGASGSSCIDTPSDDTVFRVSFNDDTGLAPPRGIQPVTQLLPGAMTTGTVELVVDNLHSERSCESGLLVAGRVRYSAGSVEYGSGIALSCGTARAFLLDPDDGTTLLGASGVSRTDAAGNLTVGGFGFQLPPDGRSYPIRVDVSDGVITDSFETTASCVQTVGSGGGGAPASEPRPDVSVQDLFVYSEDVAFLGDGTCSVGLVGIPEPGDTIGIAATIRLAGDEDPITAQPITVREHLPVNGTLQASVVAQPTVDFPAGARLANVCVEWTPQTRGSRIVEVDIDPDVITQYELNDAATRAFGVGRNLCSLEISADDLTLERGAAGILGLRNLHDESITPVLGLSLETLSGAPLPIGLTASFLPDTSVGDQPVALHVEAAAETPPGRYPLAVVANGTSCTAVASITLVVLGHDPLLDPIADQTLQCGDRSVVLSATDPDGDPLSLVGEGLPPFVQLVDQGDGTGSLEISASSADRGSHADLAVKAEDPFGFFDRESFAITVTDHAPLVAPIGDRTMTCLGGTIGVAASDEDGDTLSLSLLASTPYASLVDHQDGTGTISIATGIGPGPHALAISATDQTCGETDEDTFSLAVPANLPPLFTAIFAQEVTAGESLEILLEASDPEGGLVIFSAAAVPAFVRFETTAGVGTALVLTPGDTDVGTYSIELLATDPCGGITLLPPFELVVVPANKPPVADAGIDLSINEGTTVALDGSGSSDEDGDPLTYSWTQVAGPAMVLDDPNAVQPSFMVPYVSANVTVTFELVVHDGTVPSEPATVNVTLVNSNNPPIADAGDDATIKEGAVAELDASNSYDPEGETQLDYDWGQISGPPVTLVPSATVVAPSFTAPFGVGTELVFDVLVGDGKEWSDPDEVRITVVENSAPIANAGADQTRGEFSEVVLDGTGSSDSDGDPLTYEWLQVSGPPVTLDDPTAPSPRFIAPAVPSGGAEVVFQLVVTDDDAQNQKSSSPDLVSINVTNLNDPPRCDLGRSLCPDTAFKSKQSVDECVMWPPNHAMLAVSIAGVSDPDSASSDVTIRITGVTQDEPTNGLGDGDTSPDASIQSGELFDSVLVRAERSGLEDGRVYVVDFTADDGLESCTGSVTIGVPHDRKDEPIDSGQLYDSTGGL